MRLDVVSRLPNQARFSGGPRGTAGALFAEHADTVAGWAARLGGPRVDIEDVVQEVFTIVHRRLDQFRGDAHVRSWLYGITANVVRQQLRKARRRRWFGRDRSELPEPRPQPTPIEELEQRQRTIAVYRVLDAMRETNRTVLILAELEGLRADEIAELTGMKSATVWVRLHRAREEFSRLARKLIPDEVRAIETTPTPSTAPSRTRPR
jgi:RNA polymerase sigma-70 factor (ECF subfamily)